MKKPRRILHCRTPEGVASVDDRESYCLCSGNDIAGRIDIAGYCSVDFDPKSCFVTVETDSYEGSASMSLNTARAVYEALRLLLERNGGVPVFTPALPNRSRKIVR